MLERKILPKPKLLTVVAEPAYSLHIAAEIGKWLAK